VQATLKVHLAASGDHVLARRQRRHVDARVGACEQLEASHELWEQAE